MGKSIKCTTEAQSTAFFLKWRMLFPILLDGMTPDAGIHMIWDLVTWEKLFLLLPKKKKN